MIILASVIGLFLFYMFVERRHKIISIITLLVSGGIVVIILFGNEWYFDWQKRRKETWLTIEYNGPPLAEKHDYGIDGLEVILTNGSEKIGIPFKICNKHFKPLLSYRFAVAAYKKGRSTPHSVRSNEASGQSIFEGDTIIAPHSCEIITWKGTYIHFSHYKVLYKRGTWQE